MRKIFSLVLLSAFLATSARATESINLQTFNPSTSDHFVLLEDAYRSDWPKNTKLYLGANYNYNSEPFVILNSDGTRNSTIVDAIQTFDFMIGFKASSRFGLFLGLPVHFVKFSNSTIRIAGNESGLGDMKILGKIRITDDNASAHIALIPEIHLPTGDSGNFVSDASTYLALRAVLERQFEKFTLNVNLGFGAASNSIYTPDPTVLFGANTIDFRKRLNFGIGGFMPFNDKWGMNLEFNSLNMIPFDKNINPNELYAGLRNVLSEDAILTFGAAIGKIGGSSGQNFRAIVGLRFNIHDDENANRPLYTSTAPITPIPVAAPRVVMKAKQIELSTPVNFQENSSLLTQDGKDLLDEVADVMSNNSASFKKIQIDGHTNNKGQSKHNLWLSLERSKSVKHYLVGKGISEKVLEARGFGQGKPKVPYSNPKAMDINRRVEFNIVQ
jgi:outer membrane protein OmpA-like peptidoglycan-associated protein